MIHNEAGITYTQVGVEGTNFGISLDATFLINSIINLYSKPLRATIRELVSNAYDAAVDASERRAVVLIKDKKLIIQDFGSGMSPEFMLNRYTLIGDSTKRQSATTIGKFGMGRVSCLSITDSYTVVTCYEGIKSTYSVWRDNTIRIMKIDEEVCEEGEIGTRVEIPFESSSHKIAEIRDELEFFPNIVFKVEDCSPTTFNTQSFSYKGNEYTIRKTDGINNVIVDYCGVKYPLDFSALGITPFETNFAIKLDTTVSLSYPPNREAFTYDAKTKEFLLGKVNALKEMCIEMVDEYLNTFTNIVEKAKFVENSTINITLPEGDLWFEKCVNTSMFKIPISSLTNDRNFYFYGDKYSWQVRYYIGTLKPIRGIKTYLKNKGKEYVEVIPKTWDQFKDYNTRTTFDEFAEAQFYEAQEYYAKKLPKAEDLETEFLEYQAAEKAKVKAIKEKSEYNYWRESSKGYTGVLDRKDISFEKLRSQVIYYNLPDKEYFSFLKYKLILKISEKQASQMRALGLTLVDLSFNMIPDKNAFKNIYLKAKVAKENIRFPDTDGMNILSRKFPLLFDSLSIVKQFQAPRIDEEWLDAIIAMGDQLNIVTQYDIHLDNVVSNKEALYTLNHYGRGGNELHEKWIDMYKKSKRMVELTEIVEQIESQEIEELI